MSLILSIDTSTEQAGICLMKDEELLGLAVNEEQKDHAAWIQPAIRKLLTEAGYRMKDLEAVAVTAGPGSYTGLRVGMATAKGICYALQIPFITESTLRVMALGAREVILPDMDQVVRNPVLLCPMIDARRMEVFTALYDQELREVTGPRATILDAELFKEQLNKGPVLFFGSGHFKWKSICRHAHALFSGHTFSNAPMLGKLALARFLQKNFADLAYEHPVYLKEFYSYMKK